MSRLHSIDRNIPVLVVDDTLSIRKNVIKVLTQLGFKNVIEADDGDSALAKLNEDSVRLILSDWDMPGMMGIDFLRAVRADADLKDIPFLMIAGEARKEDVIAAIQAGVSSYMVRPFTVEDLKEKLEDLAGKI